MSKSSFNRNRPNKRRKKSPFIDTAKLIIFIIGLLIGSIITLIILLCSNSSLIFNKKTSVSSNLNSKNYRYNINNAASTNNMNNINNTQNPIANNKYDFYNLLTQDSKNLTNISPKKSTNKVPKPKYFIFIGETFTNTQQADELKATLALHGFEANVRQSLIGAKKTLAYNVIVGPFNNNKVALNKQQQLISNGFKKITIKKL